MFVAFVAIVTGAMAAAHTLGFNWNMFTLMLIIVSLTSIVSMFAAYYFGLKRAYRDLGHSFVDEVSERSIFSSITIECLLFVTSAALAGLALPYLDPVVPLLGIQFVFVGGVASISVFMLGFAFLLLAPGSFTGWKTLLLWLAGGVYWLVVSAAFFLV